MTITPETDINNVLARFPIGCRVFIRYALAETYRVIVEGTVTGHHLGLVCVDWDDGGGGCSHPDILHRCDEDVD